MIICQIRGGLGNQLFQYACARALSLEYGVPMSMDLSRAFKKDRRYALQHFKIQQRFCNPVDSILFSLPLKNARTKFLGMLGREIVLQTEKDFNFKKIKIDPNKKNYLWGYWQSEKYFEKYEKLIRAEFELKKPPQGLDQEVLEKIRSTNAVCLHVRRGDLVTSIGANTDSGLLALNYYKEAMDKVASRIKNLHFFVFSDDPEWTKNNLKSPYPMTYVTHNSQTQVHEDLRLMSSCRHFITANSTLSWWGAYLSTAPDKIVIVPKKWYARADLRNDDLIPSTWMSL